MFSVTGVFEGPSSRKFAVLHMYLSKERIDRIVNNDNSNNIMMIFITSVVSLVHYTHSRYPGISTGPFHNLGWKPSPRPSITCVGSEGCG